MLRTRLARHDLHREPLRIEAHRQHDVALEPLKVAELISHVIVVAVGDEIGDVERSHLTVAEPFELQSYNAAHPSTVNDGLNEHDPQRIAALPVGRQHVQALNSQARDAVLRGYDPPVKHELFFLRLDPCLQVAQVCLHL
jgi:hypothetical protein